MMRSMVLAKTPRPSITSERVMATHSAERLRMVRLCSRTSSWMNLFIAPTSTPAGESGSAAMTVLVKVETLLQHPESFAESDVTLLKTREALWRPPPPPKTNPSLAPGGGSTTPACNSRSNRSRSLQRIICAMLDVSGACGQPHNGRREFKASANLSRHREYTPEALQETPQNTAHPPENSGLQPAQFWRASQSSEERIRSRGKRRCSHAVITDNTTRPARSNGHPLDVSGPRRGRASAGQGSRRPHPRRIGSDQRGGE